MDHLAVVANPNRHTNGEASALEFYYSEIARIGEEAVLTEYDNSPPEEIGLIDSGLSAHRIQHQVSGFARRTVPPNCICITQGIDVGKFLCHWVVKAWRSDATAFVLDYGAADVHGTARGSDEGIERSIVNAIRARVGEASDNPYCTADGLPVAIALTLVDAGYQDKAVYAATRDLGRDVVASKGFGKSCGANNRSYPNFQKADKFRKPGDRWCLSYQETDRLWLVDIDGDYWKDFDHCRWLTAPDRPGCQFLFGEKSESDRELSKLHAMFSYHIVAEGYVDDIVRGVRQRVWKTKSDKNHWLDSSYLANVAGSMLGVRLLGDPTRPPQVSREPPNTREDNESAYGTFQLRRTENESFFASNRYSE